MTTNVQFRHVRLAGTLAIVVAAVGVAATAGAQAPRAAVARIVVQENGGTAYGSGALVDARGEYGLVVTNWHVVRDATGPIEVVFPSGFRSEARSLKLDEDWDLAALVIWRPPVAPLPLATRAPRPGDRLTICGYGSGQYREATGRCTDYYAPEIGLPHELVELNVEARQGDSGGPILNDAGQIAGVLFGAGQGTTLGSFGGRVGHFLASLAPGIGTPSFGAPRPGVTPPLGPAFQPQFETPEPAAVAATRPQATPQPPWAAPVPETTFAPPTTPAPINHLATDTATPPATTGPSNIQPPTPGNEQPPATPIAAVPGIAPTESFPAWFDTARTVFALIGLAFVGLQMVRLVT